MFVLSLVSLEPMGYTVDNYELVDMYALDWEILKNAVSTGYSNRSTTYCWER